MCDTIFCFGAVMNLTSFITSCSQCVEFTVSDRDIVQASSCRTNKTNTEQDNKKNVWLQQNIHINIGEYQQCCFFHCLANHTQHTLMIWSYTRTCTKNKNNGSHNDELAAETYKLLNERKRHRQSRQLLKCAFVMLK